ncbi:hypothetical protein CLOL250_00772 [Clostridium sp. L2-50]|nr:hypothetical protein CLOL250_00772 [Clostridium sp. L2-50]
MIIVKDYNYKTDTCYNDLMLMPHYNGYSFLLYKNISLIFRISYCTKVNGYAGMICLAGVCIL